MYRPYETQRTFSTQTTINVTNNSE